MIRDASSTPTVPGGLPFDATQIQFTALGTGAVTRTAQSKERDWVSVLDFYANGVSGVAVDFTGVVDSAGGFNAATTNGKNFFLPDGTYLLNSTWTISVSNIKIDLGNTTVNLAGSPGINITGSNVHFYGSGRNLSNLKKMVNSTMVSCNASGLEFHAVQLNGNGATFTGAGIALTAATTQDFKFLDGAIEGTNTYGIDFQVDGSGQRAVVSRNVLTTQGNTSDFFRFPTTDEFTNLGFSTTRNISDNQMAGNKFGFLGGASVVYISNNYSGPPTFDTLTNGIIANNNRWVTSAGGTTTIKGRSIVLVANLIADSLVIDTGVTKCTIIATPGTSTITDNSTEKANIFWDGFFQISHSADPRIWLYRNGVKELNLEEFGGNTYFDFTGTMTWRTMAAAFIASITQAGVLSTSSKIFPGTDAGAQQTASGLYAGTGVPNNANGANGDIYFRSDGGAGTTIYQRRAGAWVATGA